MSKTAKETMPRTAQEWEQGKLEHLEYLLRHDLSFPPEARERIDTLLKDTLGWKVITPGTYRSHHSHAPFTPDTGTLRAVISGLCRL